MAYVTATEFAQYYGLDTADTAVLADVTNKITIAQAVIDAWCGLSFEAETATTKYINGTNTALLNLPSVLRTLSSVDFVANSGVSYLSYDTSNLALCPGHNRQGVYSWLETKSGDVFPSGVQNIKVVGNWGFSTIPSDFKLAVFLTVKKMYETAATPMIYTKEKNQGREVFMNPAIAAYTGMISPDAVIIPPTAQVILASYKSLRGNIFDSI